MAMFLLRQWAAKFSFTRLLALISGSPGRRNEQVESVQPGASFWILHAR